MKVESVVDFWLYRFALPLLQSLKKLKGSPWKHSLLLIFTENSRSDARCKLCDL
jgi:hypothetical protein